MSRLIFEGDTRERFGELFPKPFIEQIRVYDNIIQTDVALYFEIEEGKDVDTFLKETGLSDLKVHLDLESGVRFESYIGTDRPLNTLLGKYIKTSGGGTPSTLEGEPPKLSDSGFAEHDFFYNTEGKKFIKFFMTIDSDIPTAEVINRKGIYLYCLTFFNFNNAMFGNRELYDKQYSEVSFEKLYNEDGSLNGSRQQVYLESSGNYYNKTPLMSLDRKFRKTDLINHQQVASTIQPIIEPYVGNTEEANLISSTLQENSNSPRLLMALKRNINNFSNKSSVTAVGTLYGLLVDALSDIDSVLSNSQTVEKRLEINSKIKDMRDTKLSLVEQIDVSATQLLGRFAPDSKFLHFPYLTRQAYIKPNVGRLEDVKIEHICVENTGYFFFDFEKALNYQSRISRFFNPYNILHIFGRNVLNKYFYLEDIKLVKESRRSGAYEDTITFKSDYRDPPDNVPEYIIKKIIMTGFDSQHNFKEKEISFFPDPATALLKSKFAERTSESIEGREDYRLRCFEFAHIESAEQAVTEGRYRIEIEIVDNTLGFFNYLRNRMYALLENLISYSEYANQFCSYNNLDQKFNTFFATNVKEQFEEPFVWEEAPVFYHAVNSLVVMSWLSDGDVGSSRRKDGFIADLEQLKTLATIDIKSIDPESGDIDGIQLFVEKFQNLFENVFDYSSVWGEQIWVNTEALNPQLIAQPNRIYERTFPITTEIIDAYDIESRATATASDSSTGGTSDFYTRQIGSTTLYRSALKDYNNDFTDAADYLAYLAESIDSFFIYTLDRSDVSDSSNPAIRIDDIVNVTYENYYTNRIRLFFFDNNITGPDAANAWDSFFDTLGTSTLSENDIDSFIAGSREELIKFVDFMNVLISFYENFGDGTGYSTIKEAVESVRIWADLEN